MSVYVVTWNLNKEQSGYDQARRDFLANLERYDNVRDAGLESVRWISTSDTPREIGDFLRTMMDDNDRLFITKLHSQQHKGWLETTVWDWINARL